MANTNSIVSKWEKFLGKVEIQEADSNQINKVKKDWNSFVALFWVVFLLKLGAKTLAASEVDGMLYLVLWSSQILPVLLMVGVIGYFAYKISCKKLYALIGLLGLFWFAVVGIFLGYFAVRLTRDSVLKNLTNGNKKNNPSSPS